LTFAETAKFVSGRWRVLPTEARETYQHQANVRKEKYYAKIAEYKKSPEYDAYQKYLKEFKTQHTASRKGSLNSCLLLFRNPRVTDAGDKLFRSETQTSTSTRSSTHEYGDQSSNSIVSSAELNSFAIGSNRAELSYRPESTSPATHSLTELKSPRIADPSSPVSASPWSATLHQERPFSQVSVRPVQSLGLDSSALERLAQVSSPTQQPTEFRPPSSLAALVRAAELARIAHEALNKTNSL
jgi:hypothetical protein